MKIAMSHLIHNKQIYQHIVYICAQHIILFTRFHADCDSLNLFLLFSFWNITLLNVSVTVINSIKYTSKNHQIPKPTQPASESLQLLLYKWNVELLIWFRHFFPFSIQFYYNNPYLLWLWFYCCIIPFHPYNTINMHISLSLQLPKNLYI